MAQGVSPVVARRRLRLELRTLREQREYTQGHVAAALEWSLSKVQRIESGDVTVSRSDLFALLAHLGVTAEEKVNILADLARTARRKITHWWDEPQFKEGLSPSMIKLIELEQDVAETRAFHPTLIPGVLQTQEYAEVLLDFWKDELSVSQRRLRIQSRLRRQEHLLERPDKPMYLLLLDESVLYRAVGGKRVMAAQLRFLRSLMDTGRVKARIVPFADAAPLANLNSFILLTFVDHDAEGDEKRDSVIYREAHVTDEIIETSTMVNKHLARFERLWNVALSVERSADLIEKHASGFVGGSERN